MNIPPQKQPPSINPEKLTKNNIKISRISTKIVQYTHKQNSNYDDTTLKPQKEMSAKIQPQIDKKRRAYFQSKSSK